MTIAIPEDKFVVLLILTSSMYVDSSSLSSFVVSWVTMVSTTIGGDKFSSPSVRKEIIVKLLYKKSLFFMFYLLTLGDS